MAKARGVKLGNPNGAEALRRAGKGGVALRATVSTNAERHEADRAGVVADIRASGAKSLRAIARQLKSRCMMARRGGAWQVSNVRGLLGRIRILKPPDRADSSKPPRMTRVHHLGPEVLCQGHWRCARIASTRLARILTANIGPNLFHQRRSASWQISIPRSCGRSSTFRSDNGNRI